MVLASVLPTPPSSPSYPSHKPVVIHIASTATVPTTLPSKSTPEVNATSTTNTISSPQTTTSEPAGCTLPRTIAALKTDLRIINWRCGAQTLTNTECGRSILKRNKQLIDSQLTSMMGLTRASPDFEPALLKLVILVHCYQHDAAPPKERRLEAWRLAFPPGNADGSEPEDLLEQHIRKALGMLSTECIARGNGWTCEKRVGGQKVQNCKKTLQELVKQDIYSSNAKLEILLKVLEWNRTCSDHQSSRHFTWVAVWKMSVMAVLTLSKPVDDQAITNNAPNETQFPPKAGANSPVVRIPPMTKKKDLLIVQIDAVSSPQDTDLASYWPKAYDTSPFKILARATRLASPALLHKLIYKKISRPLDAQDLHDGYVYAYEVEGNNGYVKVGYTTRSVTDRHDEWSFDCNRKTKSLYPHVAAAAAISIGAATATKSAATVTTPAERLVAAATTMLAPHARRIEALCHAELDNHRIKMYCGACLKQHVEWFNVSAAEVTAVIQKWSTWMATRPYELLPLRGEPKWTLKAGEVRQSGIEQFMRELAVVPTSI